MSEFNLIDEGWIPVIIDYKGTRKLVGLREFFANAHTYISLSGDMPTQDFAVMRFLLAILHTVFSRYDASGQVYELIEVNNRMQQLEEVYDEDEEEYEDLLVDTWKDLWNMGKFPDIVNEYLDTWHDRFYLFDEKYPFYQVNKDDVDVSKINRKKPSEILGKNINRLVSESGNKKALFSPKYNSNKNKEILDYDEVVRWILTYQGYTGLSDKVIFGKEKYKSSKGWLFDLGGIYLSSSNMFKTLLLNLQLRNISQAEYNVSIEKPCWEFSPSDIIKKYFQKNSIDNISELYTNWSRAIYIDNFSSDKEFSMKVVKLPEIKHENQFLESMTIWRYNNNGKNKGKFTPKKHQLNKSMWRSFGLFTIDYDDYNNTNSKIRKPGIIEWLNFIDKFIEDEMIVINSISMEDDGNATSWLPTNEINDYIYIEESVINDNNKDGWVEKINSTVENTNEIIEKVFKNFIKDIKTIRNIESKDFVSNSLENLYFEIDKPFRDWLSTINYDDNKDKKVENWFIEFKKIILKKVNDIIKNSSSRDYTGIIENDRMKNIATSYNYFIAKLNKKLRGS